jgi:hypothetical protein
MKSWLLCCLLACVAAVGVGCGSDEPTTISTSASIEFSEVEGGVWLIRAEDRNGTLYHPRILPDAFKVIGASVQVTLIERGDLASSAMIGIPADIVTIAFTQ